MRRRQTRVWQRAAFLGAIATLMSGVDAATFPVGMVVKASGPPSRVPGTYGMNAALVILPDGRQLKEGAGGGELDPAIYK